MKEIMLIEVPSLQVIAIRRRGAYRIIPELLEELFGFAMTNGITIAGMPMLLLHETSKEEAREADSTGSADVEVAVPVAAEVCGGGVVRAYQLHGGKMVRIFHRGPYETSGESYDKLFAWIEEKDLRVKGPIREIYYNDPREVRTEEIMTEILVPVE
jgi:effector-binding domain-containing protein